MKALARTERLEAKAAGGVTLHALRLVRILALRADLDEGIGERPALRVLHDPFEDEVGRWQGDDGGLVPREQGVTQFDRAGAKEETVPRVKVREEHATVGIGQPLPPEAPEVNDDLVTRAPHLERRGPGLLQDDPAHSAGSHRQRSVDPLPQADPVVARNHANESEVAAGIRARLGAIPLQQHEGPGRRTPLDGDPFPQGNIEGGGAAGADTRNGKRKHLLPDPPGSANLHRGEKAGRETHQQIAPFAIRRRLRLLDAERRRRGGRTPRDRERARPSGRW
ncbi:MAG: hypothetical protein HC813_03840 [Planctomycetes bacterium]|nr:hypothetical protein [Planctomycetota bacterium]